MGSCLKGFHEILTDIDSYKSQWKNKKKQMIRFG